VIGSLLSTRYEDHLTRSLAGHHVPAAAAHDIVGSLGGALAVAASIGGATGRQLAQVARAAFMSGNRQALGVAAFVAVGGVLLVLIRLPSRAAKQAPDIPDSATDGQRQLPPSAPSPEPASSVAVPT
jgi:hypothetical protein